MAGVLVDAVDGKIHLSGWVGPSTPSKCKAVGGGKWRAAEKRWEYPLRMDVCRALRREFGPALRIGQTLNDWARAEKGREAALAHLATAGGGTLTYVPERAPVLHQALQARSYQTAAVRFGALAGNFLNADQPGLGKSIETLGTIVEQSDHGEHLILCPSTTVDAVWGAEIQKWLPEADVVTLTGSLAQRQATLESALVSSQDHLFIVVNIESVRWHPCTDRCADDCDKNAPVLPGLFDRVWDTIVIDESHRALVRPKSLKRPTATWKGVTHLRSKRRIALSGTPMRGKPFQLFGTLQWLEPQRFSAYWDWCGRYYNITSDGYSDYVLDGFKAGGEAAMMADVATMMIRRTKAEVLTDLPPKTYAGEHLIPGDDQSPYGIWLTPTPKQIKQIKDFAEDATLDFGDDGELFANGALPVYTRGKQMAGAVHELRGGKFLPTLDSPKYDWLKGFVEDLGGERVVVASQFTSLIDVFAEGLRAEGVAVHVLTGKTSASERRRIIADFQSETPSATVFMLNTMAGGVGVTLDMADYLVLLDETTIPDDQEQVEDRIHRTSRMHNVTIYYLRTLDTLDEEVAWVAAAREEVQKYVMDGTRGVAFARRLYNDRKQVAA